MDNDWCECINIDQHLYIMTIKANISHFISNALLSFTAIVGVLYLLGEYVVRFVFLIENYNDTIKQLPLRLQFPFETQQSPIFEFLVVTIFLQAMIHVCTVAILNGLIFSLVIYILYEFDCNFTFINIYINALLLLSFFFINILIAE